VKPLPQTLQVEPLTDLATAIGDFLRTSGAALRIRRMPPRLDGVDSTRCLLSAVAERFFAPCFALEQIGHHLRKLHRRLGEWAQSTGPDK
jgi:hypothetical protein